jgi:hypothetical protein
MVHLPGKRALFCIVKNAAAMRCDRSAPLRADRVSCRLCVDARATRRREGAARRRARHRSTKFYARIWCATRGAREISGRHRWESRGDHASPRAARSVFLFEILRCRDDVRPALGKVRMSSVSAFVSATSTRSWFISKIRIGPNDSSVFGERWSNQEYFLSRTTLRHQRAIAHLRLALHLIELLGGGVARNLTHRKWQSTMIDDLDQKESQRSAHFKAARSEYRAGLRLQKVVHTGSDYAPFHGYIVATLFLFSSCWADLEGQPAGGQAPSQLIEAAEVCAGKSCAGAASDRLTSPAWVRRFLRLARRPPAQVAELVDALVSGTSGAIRGGSSPLLGTISRKRWENRQLRTVLPES